MCGDKLITSYILIDSQLTEYKDYYDRTLLMVEYAIMFDSVRAKKILELCACGKARLIFDYDISDESRLCWEFLGDIMDGCLWLEEYNSEKQRD